MVKLILGRAGRGKSGEVIAAMAAAPEGRAQILIVPEQYSHQAERRLCAVGGGSMSLRGEVLTFTRLASRVFAAAGGLCAPTLDGGGRLLAMYQAARKAAPSLTVYQRPSRKPAFLEGLLATLDECKSYRVSPEALFGARETIGGATGEKLADLGLIFAAYDGLCAKVGADPRDKLSRLADALAESGWATGKDIYLDGFTDFTPQEGLVLRALIRDAHSLTVALTCDHLEEDEGGLGIFSPARRTGQYLLRLAREAGAAVETVTLVQPRPGKAEALEYLEQELFSDRSVPWEGEAPVEWRQGADPRQEVEWACAQMLRLVREEGWRWRDMALTARDFSVYEELCRGVCERYGVPVFLARTEDILQKPVMTLLTAALDAVAGGYRYEDMFRYLKTGLGNLAPDQVDRLENYVLTWDIKGGKWTSPQPWRMHPGGYGLPFTQAEEEAVAALDALRRRVIGPLERLRKSGAATGRDWAMALYDFMEEIDLPENLTRRAEALRSRGELNLAEECAQLWDILTAALEQCAQLLDGEEMELGEWSKLFPLVLSQYQVAAIPVALDRVSAGSCTRLGYQSYKAVFFLGCDDRQLPLCAPSPGLLTDADREALTQLGLTLAPRLEDKLHREMTICYAACCLPTRRLYLTYPAQVGGEERREAFLLRRLGILFPRGDAGRIADGADPRLMAPEPALERAADWPRLRAALAAVPGFSERTERLERGAETERGHLSPQGVEALYGRRVPMSASRMDLYRSCHFAYFMRYGLRAQPRRKAGFDAPQYGTFVHAVLEEVLGRWSKTMTREETHALTQAAMERYLEEELGGLEDKSPRFAYLFRRLWGTVERVVDNVTAELASSDFAPLAFELSFGRKGDLPPVELSLDGVTVSLSGFVDRVDGWEKDGKLYLRVVDYKTGRKAFDFTDIFNGIGLQMLLYLFTLEEKGEAYFKKPIVPAGVLYLPAREALVAGPRDMPEETRQALVDKALTRRGLLLGDREALEAMERLAPGEGPRFLPLRLNKDGQFSGESLASLEQLGKLEAHVRRVFEEVGRELAAGKVSADPYWRGPEENACVWCEYRPACQFQEGRGGDCRRWQRTMGAKGFWEALEGREAGGIPTDK